MKLTRYRDVDVLFIVRVFFQANQLVTCALVHWMMADCHTEQKNCEVQKDKKVSRDL